MSEFWRRILFVNSHQQPKPFWNDLAPTEYDFLSNVNPEVPHPRWSRAYERMIIDGERLPTQLYNSYGEFVAHLYAEGVNRLRLSKNEKAIRISDGLFSSVIFLLFIRLRERKIPS